MAYRERNAKRILRLMILGDSPDDAELLMRELRRNGIVPEWRRVETEADFLAGLVPSLHVILSEFSTAHLGGSQAAGLVKALGLDVPVIVVSGAIGEEQAVALIREGVTDYVVKDRLFRLVPAVERALAERQLKAEKLHAVESLKESQRYLKGLVETCPDILYVFDLGDRRFLLGNNRLKDILGYAPEDIAEMDVAGLMALLPPEELPRVREHFARTALLPNGDVIELEHRCRHADGSWRWLLNRTAVFERAAGGTAQTVFGCVQDVTTQREALDAHLESERRFRTLIENLTEGAGLVASDETWLYANPAAEAIIGAEPGALVGRNLRECMSPEEFSRVRQETCIRMQGQKSSYRLSIRRAGGEERTIRVTAVPHCGLDGKFEATFGVFSDITEDLRRDAELEKARKLQTIGMIAGGVAHEVRNPLFAIATLVAAMKKKLADRPEVGEYLAHMNEQVERLNQLMKDLLVLGRPADPEHFVPFPLCQAVHEAAEAIGQPLAGPGARWELHAPVDHHLPVMGVSGKVSQVVSNLVQNAIAFSPPEDKVRVRIWREEGKACLSVSDSGPGIPDGTKDRIFEPFYSKRKGGTGLGLAIVHQIVTSHNGTIHVENNTPAPGATFTVKLPLAESKP